MLKLILPALILLTGAGNAWGQAATTYGRAVTADPANGYTAWSASDIGSGNWGGNAYFSEGEGVKMGGKGNRSTSKTFAVTSNATLFIDLALNTGSNTGNWDNYTTYNIGEDIQIWFSEQRQQGKVIINGTEDNISNACIDGNNRWYDLWTVHLEINTANDKLTAMTLSGRDGTNKASYTLAEPVTLSHNITTSLTVSFATYRYSEGGSLETWLSSLRIQELADFYYLKNKANGAYFAAGSNYGTKAITNMIGHSVTLSKQSEGYYIDTQIFNNNGTDHFLNGLFTDGAATSWAFASDGAGYYTISDNTGKLTAGAVGDALSLTSGTGDNTKWELLTVEAWKAEQEARLDGATASNGKDATFYIPAANFNRNDRTANRKWNGSPTIGGYNTESPSGTNFLAEKIDGYERDYTSFDVYQALTGLKPGCYKLQAQGFYRNGTTEEKNVILYANSSEVALNNIHDGAPTTADAANGFTTENGGKYVPNSMEDAAKAFNHGSYENELLFIVDESGTLRVGIKRDDHIQDEWTCIDNFRLTYYGTDLTNMIQNPSFESATAARQTTIEGWTSTYSPVDDYKFKTQNTENVVRVGTYYVERWQGSDHYDHRGLNNATFTQTIANLPAGTYKLTANAQNVEQYYRDTPGTGMYLKVGENRTEVNATVLTEAYTTLSEAGDIEIGIVLDDCSGNWIYFDNFQLAFAPEMPDLVAVEGDMDPAIASAQTATLAAYNSSRTADNYYAAKAAIAAAQASADDYHRGALINGIISSEGAGAVVVNEEAVAENWTPDPVRNTWSVEGTTDGSGMTTPFLENWVETGYLPDRSYHYVANGVENGYYEVSLLVRIYKNGEAAPTATSARLNVNADFEDLFAGGTACTYKSGTTNLTGVYKTVNLMTQVTDGTLDINLAFEGADFNWLAWKDLKVTYLGNVTANMAVNATAKWGTFCAPFDVAIPEGVTAYSCASATDAGKLKLDEITTGTIPANTPVILNAEEGLASTTFYGIKVPNESDDLITSGLLVGNVGTAGKTITDKDKENGYLLQIQDGKTGFYKMNPSKSYKIGFNRCYLVVGSNPGELKAREAFFFFEDDATAINALEAAKAETGALKDGKYLIEGKIVLVKNGVKYGANGQIVK